MAMVEPVTDTHGFPFTENATKFEIISTDPSDLGSATFVIHDEDHTLGNSLRYCVMKKYVCKRGPDFPVTARMRAQHD
ncbi:hypothetical protein HKX48_003495 [Thoreauomyces humboldtii]|nr:hypothetical protein HKX48_003495 [Thoreauomyces humboldtii]